MTILCPKCGHETRVKRSEGYAEQVIRRRVCLNPKCQHEFPTHETVISTQGGEKTEAAA
jgi:transcriptional regulator NrdR family protein